jgi:hypothetical protein
MNDTSYLQNDICIFRPLKPIDYGKRKKLLVTSLFKMASGGYKSFSKYVDGISILNGIAMARNMEVRIFIDNTIYRDDKLMYQLNQYEKVTLVHYTCSDFLIGEHHVGLFGTLVRFFPMFKFKNNDAKCAIIVDADTNNIRTRALIDLYEFLKEKK